MAVDYNDFVADTANTQMVRNILRARDRIPMQFTNISTINGTLEATVNTGLNANVVGSSSKTTGSPTDMNNSIVTNSVDNSLGATTFVPSVSLNVKNGTVFTVGIDNDQEFYNGIIGSLQPNLVVALLRQGYPEEMINHLVMSKMSFYAVLTPTNPTETNPDKIPVPVQLHVIRNAPDDPDDRKATAAALRCRRLSYDFDPERLKDNKDAKDAFGLTLYDFWGSKTVAENPNCNQSRLKIYQELETFLTGSRSSVSSLDSKEVQTYTKGFFDRTDIRQIRALSVAQADQKLGTYPAATGVVFEVPGYFNDFVHAKAKKVTLRNFESDDCDPLLDKVTGLPVKASSEVTPEEKVTEKKKTRTRTPGKDLTTSTETTKTIKKRSKERIDPDTCPVRANANGDTQVPQYKLGDLYIALSFRSVEGIMYYLGEYLRAGQSAPKLYSSEARCADPTPDAKNKDKQTDAEVTAQDTSGADNKTRPSTTKPCVPLIAAFSKKAFKELKTELAPLVKVRHQGETYIIPVSGKKLNKDAGRSSQVIGLVQTLLNLNRSSSRAPGTPLVQSIN